MLVYKNSTYSILTCLFEKKTRNYSHNKYIDTNYRALAEYFLISFYDNFGFLRFGRYGD